MRQDENDKNELLSRTDELKSKLRKMIEEATPEQIEKLNKFMTTFFRMRTGK